MKLEPVPKKEMALLMSRALGNNGRGRGSISRPLISSFMEKGNPVSKVDYEGGTVTLTDVKRIYNSIKVYAQNRNYPIRVLRHEMNIYFLRVHKDKEGVSLYDHLITEDPPENAVTKKYQS